MFFEASPFKFPCSGVVTSEQISRKLSPYLQYAVHVLCFINSFPISILQFIRGVRAKDYALVVHMEFHLVPYKLPHKSTIILLLSDRGVSTRSSVTRGIQEWDPARAFDTL